MLQYSAAQMLRNYMAKWHLEKTFGLEHPGQNDLPEHPQAIDFAIRIK